MLNRFLRYAKDFNVSDKKSFLTNVSSLGVLTIVNQLLVLMTIPYLTRILGPSGWGEVVLVLMGINTLVWFCSWGFHLGADRAIAGALGCPSKISTIFSEVISAQFILMAGCYVLLGFLLASGVLGNKSELAVAGSFLILANFLSPYWLLSGLERFSWVAVFRLLPKVLTLALIFKYVKSPNDLTVYLYILSGSELITGVIISLWITFYLKISFIKVTLESIRAVINLNFNFFIAAATENLRGMLGNIFIAYFVGTAEVGFYNVALRVKGAAITIFQPISHVLFPRMSSLYASKSMDIRKYLFRSLILLGGSSLLASVALYVMAEEIIILISGTDYLKAVPALKIISISPFLATIGVLLTHQIIIPSGESDFYKRLIFYVFIFSLPTTLILSWVFGMHGSALALVLSELVFVLLSLKYVYYHRANLNLTL